MPNSAAAAASTPAARIKIRRLPNPPAGKVRYEVSDAFGVICETDIDEACDSAEVPVYMHAYFRDHPRRDIRLVR